MRRAFYGARMQGNHVLLLFTHWRYDGVILYLLPNKEQSCIVIEIINFETILCALNIIFYFYQRFNDYFLFYLLVSENKFNVLTKLLPKVGKRLKFSIKMVLNLKAF